MRRRVLITIALLVITVAITAATSYFSRADIQSAFEFGPIGIDFLAWFLGAVGWLVALYGMRERSAVSAAISSLSEQVRLRVIYGSPLAALNAISSELAQREKAVSLNFGGKPLGSSSELAEALFFIAQGVYGAVGAEAVEIALFDESSAHYHSGLLFGTKFYSATQAMLCVAREGDGDTHPFVVVQEMRFAGTYLGCLRVQLPIHSLPTARDREIISLFAMHGCVALLNARYISDLQHMRQFSEESARAKIGFLANLSHELRGPLGLMLNGVELVRDGLCGEINDEQRRLLNIVLDSSTHLLDLMNDVLDYAKAECGRVQPRLVDMNLGDILPELGNVVRVQATAKKHKLIVEDIDKGLGVRCDRRHLRQILINLLTNAIKYTKDGGRITLAAVAAPQGRVRITVTDTGVGIPPEQHGRVFQAFERLDDPYAQEQLGTGLGMSLTKALVELNGGGIGFDSVPGEGSTFWLVLERGEVTASETVIDESPEEVHWVRNIGAVIAVVGDAEESISLVVVYLSSLGFSVRTYRREDLSGTEMPWEAEPAVILIDESAGEEIAEVMAQRYPERAVMFLTSDAFAVDIERSLRIGVEQCLVKPINLKRLGEICDEAIGRAESKPVSKVAPKDNLAAGDFL